MYTLKKVAATCMSESGLTSVDMMIQGIRRNAMEVSKWCTHSRKFAVMVHSMFYPVYTGRFKLVRNRFQLLSSLFEVSVNAPKSISKQLESDLNCFLQTSLGGSLKRFCNRFVPCVNANRLKTL